MEQRVLKINTEKTESMVTGYKARVSREDDHVDAVEEGCNKWYHNRCSGLKNLQGVQNLVCPRCAREGEGGDGSEDDKDPGLLVNGGVLEKVEQFCYLGDVLDSEAGVERAV